MLGTPKSDIAETIVQKLSFAPRQAMAELAKGNPGYTRQAWYKALRALRRDGVIVREHGGLFSLSQGWIVEMLWLTSRMQTSYIRAEQLPRFYLPSKNGERKVFRFNDIMSMNSFWSHLLLMIAARNVGATMYAYDPHFWFYLAHGPVERQYNRGMSAYKIRTLMVVGGNNFLDRWNANHFPKDTMYWLSPKPLYPRQQHYLNLLGDYFLDIKIDHRLAALIHRRFSTVTSFADVPQLTLVEELQGKSPCSISITKQATGASAFKRKIERLF